MGGLGGLGLAGHCAVMRCDAMRQRRQSVDPGH